MRLFRVSITILILTLFTITPVASQDDTADVLQFLTSQSFSGNLDNDTPTATFPILIRRSQTTLNLDLSVTSGDIQPFVTVANDEGSVLAESGLALPTGTTAQLSLQVESYGAYQLIVSRASDSGAGSFTLEAEAIETEIEADLIGIIDDETPFLNLPIFVRETGSTVTIDMREITDGLDTKLYLVDDQTGLIVGENDDRVRGDTSSFIVFRQAARGGYTIIATRYGEADGRTSGEFRLNYRIETPEEVIEDAQRPYDVLEGALLDRGFPITPAFEPRERTTWTVLAYYGGDTNLEDGIIQDMNEFEIAGRSEDVRIIVLLDRSPEYDTSNGDWTTARIFEIGPETLDSGDHRTSDNPEGNYPPTLDTPHITDLGSIDTGDGEVFAQFLIWGIRYFPADNYVISLASHGAGWEGLITDYTAGTILSPLEMQQALELARTEAGVEKFAFLINDACLMSSVEYYDTVAPFFDYALASPEIIVNPAHDMTVFTNELKSSASDPDFTRIGNNLVDQYINVDIQQRVSSDTQFLTSALTRLADFPSVSQAVESFAAVINRQNPVAIANILGQARSNAYTYTQFLRFNTMIDLGDFMRRVQGQANVDPEIFAAAQHVIDTLNAVRVYQNGGDRVDGRIDYYNIYFPEDSNDFNTTYFEQTPLPEWSRMLRNYYTAVTPKPWEGESAFHTPTAPRIRITDRYPSETASVLTPVNIGLEIVGRNIANVDVVVDRIQEDGLIVRLLKARQYQVRVENDTVVLFNNWLNGVDQKNNIWDVRLPVIADGQVEHYEALIIEDTIASVRARYCPPDAACGDAEDSAQSWNEIVITFTYDPATQSGVVQRVVSEAANNALAVIDIPHDSQVQIYRQVVTEDGRTISEPGNIYVWPEGGLTWNMQPAPTGEYNYGIEVAAFGGTTGFAATPVSVDNSDIPEEIRTFSNLAGFNVPYPIGWNEFAFVPAATVFRTGTLDGNTRSQVYFTTNVDSTLSLEEITRAIAEQYDFSITSGFEMSTVDGTNAITFDMAKQEEEQQYVGRAFAVYLEESASAFVFSSESTDDGEAVAAQFEHLVTYTNFFSRADLIAQRLAGRQWNFRAVEPSEEIVLEFPMRANWIETGTIADIWTRFAPPDNPEYFFATGVFNLGSRIEGIPGVLSTLLTGYALENADELILTANRILYAQNHVWEATTFTVKRDGLLYSGRLYTTQVGNTTVASWIEAPMIETEDGFVEDDETFRLLFEPILDGLAIYTD
ncbi:MAG: clostripain-related cysteine peptidase [Chloroflexota bacterium]